MYASDVSDGNTVSENFEILGPVVQSVVRLTSSLRVISLTVLADSICNAKATHIFSAKNFSIFAYHSIKILTNR